MFHVGRRVSTLMYRRIRGPREINSQWGGDAKRREKTIRVSTAAKDRLLFRERRARDRCRRENYSTPLSLTD